MRRRSNLLPLVGAAACSLAGQQAAAPSQHAMVVPLVEPWPQVAMDVRVRDRSDQAVANLRAEQLSVRDNRRDVTGDTLTFSGDEPQSVCLLLDNSGSTYPERDALLEEATTLLRDIPAADETCLINFSVAAYVDAPLTMDRLSAVKGLRYFRPSGGSALRDAMIAAATYLERNGKFRSRAIVLISDAGENASTATETDAERAFAERGAPTLFALLPGPLDQAAGHDEVRPILRLIDDTGGTTFKPTQAADRKPMVDSLVHAMSDRYRLAYQAPDPAADGREHKVDVHLEKGLAKQEMSVSVPRRYYAPAQ